MDIATVIVHFGKPRHGYFEINVRNGEAGRLLIVEAGIQRVQRRCRKNQMRISRYIDEIVVVF